MTDLLKMLQELKEQAQALGFGFTVSLHSLDATVTSVVTVTPDEPEEEEEEEAPKKKKAAAKKKPAEKKKPAAKKKKKPEPEPEPEDEDEDEDEDDEEGVTFEDVGDRVRLACKEYVKGDVSAFMKEYGVKRVSDLTEDQYEDFYSQLDDEFPSE